MKSVTINLYILQVKWSQTVKSVFGVLFSSSLHSSKTDNRSEKKNIFPCFYFLGWRFCFFSSREKQCLSHGGTTRTRSKLCSSFSFRQLRCVCVCVFVSLKSSKPKESDNGCWLRSAKVSRFVFFYLNVNE